MVKCNDRCNNNGMQRVVKLNFILGKVQLVFFWKISDFDSFGLCENSVVGRAFEVRLSANWSVVFAVGLIQLDSDPNEAFFEFCLADEFYNATLVAFAF